MTEPAIIFEEPSPSGNLEAIVEQDDRVAYLYLRSPINEEFGIKGCWIRNLAKAPEELTVEEMKEGIAPMLPREHCLHPEGSAPLKPDDLSLVWFPEGDGVALLERGEMIAAIPGWAGIGGFPGYARDCAEASSLCWKLEDPTPLEARIKAAQDYWAQWDDKRWPALRDAYLAAYEQPIGKYTRYFAMDGNHWPPKALIRVDSGDRIYLLTLGISVRPMPKAEQYYDQPAEHRRFEFAACFSASVPDDTVTAFARYLAGQSNLPWDQFTLLGDGHTLPCDALQNDPKLSKFTFVLLAENPPTAPEVNLPRVDEDRVALLWAIPITKEEQAIAEAEGSAKLLAGFSNSQARLVIGSH